MKIKNFILIAFIIIITSFNSNAQSNLKSNSRLLNTKYDYYHKMLRDPVTDNIPNNIRELELEFARQLNQQSALMKKNENISFTYFALGPDNLGGRTRALAVDRTDTNIIIAGAVSGGIWKSTDGGNTWEMKSSKEQNLSVTSIVQDPRQDSSHIWYYATGELGELYYPSASDRGQRAYFLGSGIFKSTDNGETWNLLPATKKDPTQWNSPYDYVSKIIVNPKSGSVFLASSAWGIYRSTNGGSTFTRVLGRTGDNFYCDIDVNSNGTLIAFLSQYGNNTISADTGVLVSRNNGNSWTNITPNNFPGQYQRGVLAVAPSDTNIVYLLLNTGVKNISGNDDVRFYRINITTLNYDDRTSNLPDFADGGVIDVQNNFSMMISVKPDNKDVVLIGGTNLFRSFDGFATKPVDLKTCWIGGFAPDGYYYPQHHSGQHIVAFNPKNPMSCYSGHSGGISFTSNILNSTFIDYFPWINKNQGYNVSQFYTISLVPKINDNRIIGGTQDNGITFFLWDTLSKSNSKTIIQQDGGYCYLEDSCGYISTIGGDLVRIKYNTLQEPDKNIGFSKITPKGSSEQLYINPYILDPVDKDIMYYPSGNTLWRNNSLSTIPENEDSSTIGWYEFTNMKVPDGYEITALAMSPDTNLKHLLYYGASSLTQQPRLYKLLNADDTTAGAKYTTITTAPGGSYIHNIAVNPEDARELLVVLSNYNITGIYHSIDSGKTLNAVQGNLTGNTSNPGPSIRCAKILNSTEGTIYLVGTSTGLYSTKTLNGSGTEWLLEGQNEIGNVIVENIDAQKFKTTLNAVDYYNYRIAVATHGRGVFIGWFQTKVGINLTNNSIPDQYYLSDNYPNPFNPTTKIDFAIPKYSNVNITIYNIAGEKIIELVNGNYAAGKYQVVWNGRNQFGQNVASGVYFYQMKTGEYSMTKKLVLLK